MTPYLDKRTLAGIVAAALADIPKEISSTVVDLIFARIAQALVEGQEVSLRGFGRIIPRYYKNTPSKRLGVLFHPSPKLTKRCNPGSWSPSGS
jgi:hypothetical protein